AGPSSGSPPAACGASAAARPARNRSPQQTTRAPRRNGKRSGPIRRPFLTHAAGNFRGLGVPGRRLSRQMGPSGDLRLRSYMMAGTPQRQRGPRARRSRRFWRVLSLSIFAAGVAGVLGLWIAVNRVEWLGPYVADGLRAVVGVDAVASLEDFSYRVQDRINRVWRRGEKPRAYWSVPS